MNQPRQIKNVTPGYRKPRKWRLPRLGFRKWKWPDIPIWLSAVILFVGLNIFVVGGQKLWRWDDNRRLDALKLVIESDRVRLTEQESRIRLLASEIELVARQIDQAGISTRDRNALVVRHNDRLELYEVTFAAYSSSIDAANMRIEQANALSKKIGGTWYVIPIPRGSSSHK